MKRLILAFSLGVMVLASAFPAEPATTTDSAWNDYEKALAATSGSPGKLSLRELSEWLEAGALALREKGEAFIKTHPDDPRRWQVVYELMRHPPRFVQSYGPNIQTNFGDVVVDGAAADAWKQQLADWKEQLNRATDLPSSLKERLEQDKFFEQLWVQVRQAEKTHSSSDWDAAQRAVSEGAVRYPAGPDVARLAYTVASTFGAEHSPGQTLAFWQVWTASPNERLAKFAQEKVGAYQLLAAPIDLKFTAADGREVDLTKLRGKVVLVDFWATWCHPCVAELPNVKKVYAAYHDKGFEVVAIALENGKLAPTDTPEQTAAKLAVAKKFLTDFTAKNEMPWPQQFDGKWWKNDISTRYAINAIPAMFLVDQEGMIVSTSARGEMLEKEVKRLLKL